MKKKKKGFGNICLLTFYGHPVAIMDMAGKNVLENYTEVKKDATINCVDI